MVDKLQRPDFVVGTLPNGLRWIHQQVASPTGHIGILLPVGSRDEAPEEEGLAHFIEHLLFKGTTRRKAYHILSRIEDVGGELNAYTGKEDTTLYASFLVPHYGRSMELLFDILQNARFPEKEIPKEKDVILDEIDSYRDSPSELIFDEFDALVYGDHPLGRNILGTEDSVPTFTREQVVNFVRTHYRPEQAVLSSVGGISAKQFERMALKYAASWTVDGPVASRLAAPAARVASEHRPMDIHQSHLVLGGEGMHVHHDDLTAMVLLNNLLGGPAMNSRLNLNIRERHGIAYHIESFFNPYSGPLGRLCRHRRRNDGPLPQPHLARIEAAPRQTARQSSIQQGENAAHGPNGAGPRKQRLPHDRPGQIADDLQPRGHVCRNGHQGGPRYARAASRGSEPNL